MRLYLDANPIIYSIEGLPEFRLAALAWIERAEANRGLVITSRLFSVRTTPICRSALMASFLGKGWNWWR